MLFEKAPAPLVVPAIIWICGLWLGYFLDIDIVTLVIALPAILLLSKLLKFRFIMILLLVFSSGLLRMKIAEFHPQNHISQILNNTVNVEITGKISRIIKENKTYRCELLSINKSKCCGAIRLNCFEKLAPGDIISADIILEKPEGKRNPADFDWRLTWRTKDIYGFGKVINLNRHIAHQPIILQRFRNLILKRLKIRLGNNYPPAAALLIGHTSEIDYEYKMLLQNAGLSHLFAISGMHVGLIAVIFLSVMKLFLKRKTANNFLLIFLIIYGFLCNWSASVSRAVVMFVVYQFSRILERPVNFHQIIAITLIIITLISPIQIFSVGLQLSTIAVIVIYNLLNILRKIRIKNPALSKFYRNFIITILLTIAIIIALLPITLSTFGKFSANAVIAVIPATLIISIILPVVILIAILPVFWHVFADAYFILLYSFNQILEFSASLPFKAENIFLEYWQAVIIYIAFIALIFFVIKRKFLAAIFLPAAVFIILLPFWHNENPPQDFLRITCLDCGQGDMAFLEFPKGENMLVDTGPPDGKWTAEQSLLPWLNKRRINSIDFVVITHAHNDHYGGINSVFEALTIKTLITNETFWSDINDLSIEKSIFDENCRLLTLSDTTSFFVSNAKISFIYPPLKHKFTNVNNNSLVMMLDYNGYKALFTGDIEKEAEEYLVNKFPDYLNADFLKIPHHGSYTSSTQKFINYVSPDIAFIPAGKNNRFGFPDRRIRNRYDFLNENLIIAAEDGALIIETNGKTIIKKAMLRN